MNRTGTDHESQADSITGEGAEPDTGVGADATRSGTNSDADGDRDNSESKPPVSPDDSSEQPRARLKRSGRRTRSRAKASAVTNIEVEADAHGVDQPAPVSRHPDTAEGGRWRRRYLRGALKPRARQGSRHTRVAAAVAFAILPALGLGSGAAASYLKWRDATARAAQSAAIEATAAATDSTVAILSYEPGTVRTNLTGARDRLTGGFRDAYTKLINDVVIPGAEQKKITTLVTVPGAASLSATPDHAVVLVYVNQNVTMDTGAPTDTASSVKVTLDKVGGRWLISAFDPI